MSVGKDIEITSLSEYIKLLENYSASEYFFRGEHCFIDDIGNILPFERRVTGAFLQESASGRNTVFPSFIGKINKYYENVGHRLSDIEKDNFIAFSQHHGLPTNLLDVTSSPLVALFFACYEDKCCKFKKTNRKGTVYIFDKDYIDITDVITEFHKLGILEQNIIESLINAVPTVVKQLIRAFQKHIDETFKPIKRQYNEKATTYTPLDPSPQTTERLYQLYGCVFQLHKARVTAFYENPPDFNEFTFNKMVESIDKGTYFYELAQSILKEEEMSIYSKIFDLKTAEWADVYLLLFIYFLKWGYFVFEIGKMPLCEGCEIKSCVGRPKFLPNLIYKPKITFDRARAQQGYFIYQPYRKKHSNIVNGNEIVLIQETECIKEVRIKNTEKILNQLNDIGINYGTLFGDFDNIAKHIKEKA